MKKVFSERNLIILSGCILLGFTGVLFWEAYKVSRITVHNQEMVKQAQQEARMISGREFTVTVDANEPTTRHLAIYDSQTNDQYSFEACTDRQRDLRAGDRVWFKYNDRLVINPIAITKDPLELRYCYLAIAE